MRSASQTGGGVYGLLDRQAMTFFVTEHRSHDDHLNALALVTQAVTVGALRQAVGHSGRRRHPGCVLVGRPANNGRAASTPPIDPRIDSATCVLHRRSVLDSARETHRSHSSPSRLDRDTSLRLT
jgi:hypothetical protein